MSLICAKELGESRYRVFCENCGVETDTVDGEELSGMVRVGYRVFCPKCEGITQEYHPVFGWDGEPFFVWIGGILFRIDWPKSVREVDDKWKNRVGALYDFLASSRNEQVSSLACLVSTYLNKLDISGGEDE